MLWKGCSQLSRGTALNVALSYLSTFLVILTSVISSRWSQSGCFSDEKQQ